MLLESSWGTLGGLLDPPGRLLGVSWAALAASWAPGGLLERPWRRLGALLESSWGCLGRVLEALGGFLEASGGLVEASWRRLKGPWTLLRASWKHLGAVCSIMSKSLLFFSMIFEVPGACGTLLWRSKSLQKGPWSLSWAQDSSWRHLEGCWRLLEASWSALGRS